MLICNAFNLKKTVLNSFINNKTNLTKHKNIYKLSQHKYSTENDKEIFLKAVECCQELETGLANYFLNHVKKYIKNASNYPQIFSIMYPGRTDINSVSFEEGLSVVSLLNEEMENYEEFMDKDPTNGLIFYSYLVCKHRNNDWLTNEDVFILKNKAIIMRALYAKIIKSVARINSYRHLFLNKVLLLNFLEYVKKNMNNESNFILDTKMPFHTLSTMRFNLYAIAERLNLSVEDMDIMLNLDHTQGILLFKYLGSLNNITDEDKNFIAEKIKAIKTCLEHH